MRALVSLILIAATFVACDRGVPQEADAGSLDAGADDAGSLDAGGPDAGPNDAGALADGGGTETDAGPGSPTAALLTQLAVGSVTHLSDLDGDGTTDLAYAAEGWSADGGVVRLVRGPIVDASTKNVAPPTHVLRDPARRADLISRVMLGDLNHDGLLDVVAADIWNDRTFVTFGPVLDPAATLASGAIIEHPNQGGAAFFGRGMAIGDLSGDGQPDLVLGAAGEQEEICSFGTGVYVFFGPLQAGVRSAGTADVVLTLPGQCPEEDVWIADLDHDGHSDLVTGGKGADAFVFRGPLQPGALDDNAAFARIATGTAYVGEVAAPGDLSGDGRDDLVLFTSGDGVAQMRIFFGPLLPGSHPATSSDAAVLSDATYTLLAPDGLFANDLDGDGKFDVVIPSLGRAHVFFGPIGAGERTLSDAAIVLSPSLSRDDSPSTRWITGGDFTGDSRVDLLVGGRFLYSFEP